MDKLDRIAQRLKVPSIGRRTFLTGSAALVAGAAGLVGSGRSARADTPKQGGDLVIGTDGGSNGDSLDPATYTATYAQVVGMQLYNNLIELDEHNRPQPSLAASWEAKPGATEWVIRLRKDVTFHNGKTMTAEDVVYSLNHHRSADSKSAAKAFLAPVKDIKATTPNELTITLDGPNADLPYLIADYHLCIGPDGVPFDKGIGTGAFVLKAFEPGVRTRTERNPNHWNPDRGFVDSVTTLVINDPTARMSALQSGAINLMNRVDPKVVALLKKDPKLQVFEISGAGHYCFPMRCDKPPFDNNDLRLALKYAIDREEMLKKALGGHGKIGNDQPIPAFDPYFAADIPQRPYDPDKAKFHLKKSGYSGPVSLTIAEGTFTGAMDAAQIYQESATKAGIDFKIDRVPNDGYWDDVWMKAGFCGSYWGGRPTPDLMFSVAYASDAPWNETFWKRPDFDKLLLAARGELDETKRKQMYHDLQAMVVDDCGEIIPMFNNFIEAGSSNLAGYVSMPVNEFGGFRAAERVWFKS